MFTTYLVDPIYNAFIFLLNYMPGGDVGLAIITLTLIVRIIFYPVFASSIRTSMAMQAVKPQLDEINQRYKDDTEERSKRTMELFKLHRVRPFSTIIATVLQLVILIALYWALFYTGLPAIETARLYPGIAAPAAFSTNFFGIFDLFTPHHIVLAVLVGVSQYFVMHFSLSRMNNLSKNASETQKVAQKMQNYMMLYFLPAMVAVITYAFPGAVGLYFVTGNIVSLGQEWLIRRKPL